MIGFDLCGEDAAGCACDGAVAIDKRIPSVTETVRRRPAQRAEKGRRRERRQWHTIFADYAIIHDCISASTAMTVVTPWGVDGDGRVGAAGHPAEGVLIVPNRKW